MEAPPLPGGDECLQEAENSSSGRQIGLYWTQWELRCCVCPPGGQHKQVFDVSLTYLFFVFPILRKGDGGGGGGESGDGGGGGGWSGLWRPGGSRWTMLILQIWTSTTVHVSYLWFQQCDRGLWPLRSDFHSQGIGKYVLYFGCLRAKSQLFDRDVFFLFFF